ncbi:hypothetical protein IWX92DRAFT_425576, partial [Phyllosticta citricarpa]
SQTRSATSSNELAEAFQSFRSEKKAVLETAFRFINQMSHVVHSEATPSTNSCTTNIFEIISPPSPEFVRLMLAGNKPKTYSSYDDPLRKLGYPEFSSFISAKTLERMAVALVDAKEDGATLIQYSICINSYAYAFLTCLPREEMQEPMMEVLDRSRDVILAKPTLPLLQALLSGVVLLQRLGDTPKCWTLNTVACRVCVALGLHHPQPLSTPYSEQTQEEEEARACLLWTFIFDKGSAMGLHGPVVLPVWDVPVEIAAPSDPEKPFAAILATLYQFATVQATNHVRVAFLAGADRFAAAPGAYSFVAQEAHGADQEASHRATSLPATLNRRKHDQRVDLARLHLPLNHMTLIIRSDSSIVSDAIKREECLENARAAFIALQNLCQRLKSAMDEKCVAMFLPGSVSSSPAAAECFMHREQLCWSVVCAAIGVDD